MWSKPYAKINTPWSQYKFWVPPDKTHMVYSEIVAYNYNVYISIRILKTNLFLMFWFSLSTARDSIELFSTMEERREGLPILWPSMEEAMTLCAPPPMGRDTGADVVREGVLPLAAARPVLACAALCDKDWVCFNCGEKI